METKVYFENIEKILLEELSKSESSVKLVVAWLTNKKLFAKLVELAEKGIVVNVIINNDEINRDSFLDYSRLNIGESFLKMLETKNGNILHHKFCIIDENIVINGSYNWTYKANYNNENIHINTDVYLAKQHSIEFINILTKANEFNRNSYKDENFVSSINIIDENKKNPYEEDELRYKMQKEQLEEWKKNQDIYSIKFINYLQSYLISQEYKYLDGVNGNSLEVELFALVDFYQNSTDFYKHTSFAKHIFYNIFNEFRSNISRFDYKIEPYCVYREAVSIRPYFKDKIKDIIYQDRFSKSMNAYSYKIGLILVMLDYAYGDYEYSGLLFDEYDWLMDYSKKPKVFSTNIVKILQFLKELRLDELEIKTEEDVLHINNCIRYYNNGMHFDIFLQPEYSKNAIQDLKNIEEYEQKLRDSELEFRDTIIKMNLSKFDKIKNELKENGLKNSFILTKTITEINLNIDLGFITNEEELKLLIQNFVAQKVIIKDIIHNGKEDSYKINTLQWSFDKSKEDIKKESSIIDFWSQYELYEEFEYKYSLWKKLEKEKAKNKSYEDYETAYKLLSYLKSNNIEFETFTKEDEKHKNTIREIAAKVVQIPEFLPNGFNILELFNSLKVNTAHMPISKEIIIAKNVNKGNALDDLFKDEFNGQCSNIQIIESVKPFIWLENGKDIKVNKNAKKCKNSGQYLLHGKDYIFRHCELILGNPKNELIKYDSKTNEIPNYDAIEKQNQLKYNSNLP